MGEIKRYKLLRDLPGVKAGSTYKTRPGAPDHLDLEGEIESPSWNLIPEEYAIKYPEWFELLPEPIKIVQVKQHSHYKDAPLYQFLASRPIETRFFTNIQKAIEEVLNEDKLTIKFINHSLDCKYTEKDLEDAFNAATQIPPEKSGCIVTGLDPNYFLFPTFQSYLSSLNKK